MTPPARSPHCLVIGDAPSGGSGAACSAAPQRIRCVPGDAAAAFHPWHSERVNLGRQFGLGELTERCLNPLARRCDGALARVESLPGDLRERDCRSGQTARPCPRSRRGAIPCRHPRPMHLNRPSDGTTRRNRFTDLVYLMRAGLEPCRGCHRSVRATRRPHRLRLWLWL